MAERRQHPRYGVRNDQFVVFSCDCKIAGRLNNISQGGLAFHYSPVDEHHAESSTIDIMGKSPDPFFLPSVACQTRYDISVLAEDRTFSGAKLRQAGVQFFKLDENQAQKLELFIQKYGREPAEEID